MVSTGQTSFDPLELRDRAVRFVASRGTATEDEVLVHVYGGVAPAALRASLAAPLLADPRLQHQSDGTWTMREHASDESPGTAFTALAVVATGPTPGRGRPVHISALHVRATGVVGRFEATLNPHARVPRYVAQRLGLEAEVLDSQPDFEAIFDDLVHFLARRPVLAQDARLTWSFLGAESRRIGRTLEEPRLLDLNELATRLLDLKVKPSLGLVAAQLGIGSLRIAHPDEEARVLGIVGARLLAMDVPDGVGRSDARLEPGTRAPLRRGATARALPDLPGVYILRDVDQTPLYVGKARRLSSRMAAYVHRPLGATRRLEGLVAAVHSVDSTPCATDLEALILEDREIRRLQPRFNTARRQRPVRLWIRLPAERPPAGGRRQRAPLRLELSARSSGAEGEHVGPFRNESLAAQARQLAREVFDLDALRRTDRRAYAERLAQAWAFLHGSRDAAEERARARSRKLLRQVVAFEVSSLLLPADPREATYAVVRPGPVGIEGFLVERARLRAWTVLDDGDPPAFARRLLEPGQPRTGPEDVEIVLRWFGAQRPAARLVWVPDHPQAAAEAIEQAASALMAWEA